jgi:hypothetical protein
MNIIVRFEFDACLDTSELAVDDLADALGGLLLHQRHQRPRPHGARNTSSTDWSHWIGTNELYPQLVFPQTPGLRLGVHENGTFRSYASAGEFTGARDRARCLL